MKNYKFIVPVLLVVMFIGSIYMLYDSKAAELETYNTTLATARDFRAKDIQIDAEKHYLDALSQNATVDLYVEIGEFYFETGQVRDAVDWGETIVKEYPEAVKGYEFLLDIYDKQEDYVACFKLYDTIQKRQLESDVIKGIVDKNKYKYYLLGEYHDAGIYSGGLCPVAIDGKWGYVNETGNLDIKRQYTNAGPFIQDLAPIVDMEGNAFYIDTKGNKKHVVLGVESVHHLGLIESGMFPLFDGEKWHFYNTENEKLFGDFEEVSAMGNGIAAVSNGNGWKLIDRSGTDITGSTYRIVATDAKNVVYRNERLFVSDGTIYRMITSTGEIVGSDGYEDVHIFNDTTYAAVKINGKWGFIDKNGDKKIAPQYEDARSFANGFAAVKMGGLWGFIDMDGNVVIEPQFEDARDFNSKGCVFVLNAGEWTLLKLYKSNH